MARRRRVRKLSRATRAKISRALKAYYRNQRRIARVRLANLEKARQAKRRLERQRRRIARRPVRPPGVDVTHLERGEPVPGRFAFKALEQQPDILDVRAGKRPGEDVTAN